MSQRYIGGLIYNPPGGFSGYFDGSGDTLTAANNAAFNPGTGDFTIECWINTSATVAYQTIASVYGAPGSYNGWYFGLNSAGTKAVMSLFNGSSAQTDYTSTTTVNNGAWCHIAFVRTGTTVGLFINGTREATGTNSYNITATSGLQISGYPATSRDWNGYISNFRIIKGSGPYDATQSTLTVPTAPLTNITNTSLLLNFTNGGIIDNAMMNDLETVGNAQISTSVSKFGGGSMLFNGTNSGLFAASSPNLAFSSGDFTVEGWVYFNANLPYLDGDGLYSACLFGQSVSSGLCLIFKSGGSSGAPTTLAFTVFGVATVNTTISTALNTWYHVAVTKSSGTVRVFLNGVQQNSFSNSTTFAAGASTVGYLNTASYFDYFPGHIDDLRITKGIARYVQNFTPPTQAFQTQ